MPELRVTLPSSCRRNLLLCLLPLLLPAPSRAQGPKILPSNAVPPPAARVAARTVPENAAVIPIVTIPREEYERLKAAAADARQPAAVVTEAHYTAAVADGTAKIGCRFVVQVLKGPWAEIPVNFGDAAVGLLSSGKTTTAFLRARNNGRFTLAVKETGRHEIRLELQAKVKTQAAGGRFSFSGPPAGISTLDVVIPHSSQRITVSPTFVPESVTPKPGTSRVKGHLAAASKITVTWRAGSVSDRSSPVHDVENRTHLRVRDESLQTESRLTYRVHRGSLAALQITAPAKDRILDVACSGGLLSAWTIEKQNGRQQIRIALTRPVSDRVIVTVRTERNFSEGTVSVAGLDEKGNLFGIHAAESNRETGLLVLSHVPQWDVTVPPQPGWVPLESTEVAGESTTPAGQYVRYFHPKTPFSIRIQPVKPRLTATHKARVSIRSSRIEVTSRLQYQIDRIGVPGVSLRIPVGLTVDQVRGDRVKSFAVAGAPAVLQLAFDRRVTGKTGVTIYAHRDLADPAKPAELELPLPEPDGVDRESGRVELFAPDAIDVVAVPEKSSGVTTAAIAPQDGQRALAAWSFDVRPLRITVKTKRRTPRITANLGTRIDVRESSVGVTSDLEFRVFHAPAKSFRFAVPAAVAGSVRVTDAAGNAIATRPIGPLPSAGKKTDSKKSKSTNAECTVLEVESPYPIVGVHRLKIQYELELAKSANGGQPLAVRPIRVLGVGASELHGEISVARARSFQLNVRPGGGDVEPADGRELSFLPPSDGQHFQYHREPVTLAIGISKLEIETVAETVVSRGLIEILLVNDSDAAYRARYRVLSSERQRLRLDLPKSCEPLGVFVNGSPVTLERDPAEKESEEWSSYLVNVSRPQPSEVAFSLVVQFRMPVKPAPFQVPLGRLRLNLPRIHNPNGSAAVVQQQRTVVWVPNGYVLHGNAEGFTRQTTTRLTGLGPRSVTSHVDIHGLENWIGVASPGGIEFPTQGHAYQFDSVGTAEQLEIATADMPFATWVLSVPFLLMGLVLARTTWHNRLILSLLLLFAATVAAVSWGDATYHALLAARYGLAGVAAVWLLHGVFAARTHGPSQGTGARNADRTAPCPLPLGELASVVIPPPGLFSEKSQVNP